MNENIRGRFIRLLPVEGDIAAQQAGANWVKASAITRVTSSDVGYSVRVDGESFRCSNDPFALIAEMEGV